MIKITDKRIKNVDLKISLPVSILKKCKYLLMHNNRDTNVMNKNIIPVKMAGRDGKKIEYEKIVEVKTMPHSGNDGTVIIFNKFLNSSNFKNKTDITSVRSEFCIVTDSISSVFGKKF